LAPPAVSVPKEVLRAHLSPPVFAALRRWWWYSSFYVFRRLRALLVTERPAAEGSPALVKEVAAVNVAWPTIFCRSMTCHGSDKGAGWHTYTTVYARLLRRRRSEPLRIFELGIGTNTVGIASGMGVHGLPGASLRGWRDLFPKAAIHGADIDRRILFSDDRIRTHYCDQRDAGTIQTMWTQPALRTPFDVIIDDGLHTPESNLSFLEGSLQYVRSGGLYVIEDIRGIDLDRWRAYIPEHQRLYPRDEIALVQLPSPTNKFDNNLLIIRRTQQTA